MVGGGFEPPKASPTDLQSVPFGRSGTPPKADKPVLQTRVFYSLVRAIQRSKHAQPCPMQTSVQIIQQAQKKINGNLVYAGG
jgi:hypothetical protein